jgi:hypothetical protein
MEGRRSERRCVTVRRLSDEGDDADHDCWPPTPTLE